MGTEITLQAGAIELTFAKNFPGDDHGCLFQESDRKLLLDASDPSGFSPGFSVRIAALLPRLELLGYTLERARQEYEIAVAVGEKRGADFAAIDGIAHVRGRFLPFDDVLEIVRVMSTQSGTVELDRQTGKPCQKIDPHIIERLPWHADDEFEFRVLRLDGLVPNEPQASHFLSGFDPYTAIRLLAENPRNLAREVIWHYGPLVRQGWAVPDEFQPGLDERSSFLLVTEGSSDAAIIRHAISLLKPKLSDFFHYVDMHEGYPFSGTGSLHNFIRGFVSLGVPLRARPESC